MRAIRQFMWGYQPHFRMSLESAAETALNRIGANLEPIAMLVGFKVDADHPGLPICVEPETGTVQPEHLDGVLANADRRYQDSEDAGTFHSHPDHHRAQHALYRDRHRADALAEALAAAPGGAER